MLSPQIDAPSIPAESTPEIAETQTSVSPQGEVQHVNPQTDKPLAESAHVETVEPETSNSPQPEGPCWDPQTDAHPIPAESTEPETHESQTIISPQKESVTEDSPPAQLQSPPDTSSQKEPSSQPSSQKEPKEKQKSSPQPEQPPRRSTRRQLQLEEFLSPEPYGKKLRSASGSAEQLSSSPQPLKRTKSAVKSALREDTTVEQPPPKRARGKSLAEEAESQQEESEQATVSEKAQEGLLYLHQCGTLSIFTSFYTTEI